MANSSLRRINQVQSSRLERLESFVAAFDRFVAMGALTRSKPNDTDIAKRFAEARDNCGEARAALG